MACATYICKVSCRCAYCYCIRIQIRGCCGLNSSRTGASSAITIRATAPPLVTLVVVRSTRLVTVLNPRCCPASALGFIIQGAAFRGLSQLPPCRHDRAPAQLPLQELRVRIGFNETIQLVQVSSISLHGKPKPLCTIATPLPLPAGPTCRSHVLFGKSSSTCCETSST